MLQLSETDDITHCGISTPCPTLTSRGRKNVELKERACQSEQILVCTGFIT
jgi:hypothetical protein